MDGRLDEAIYTAVPSISDFVQMEPKAGASATEKTELWLFFDDRNVYVTFRNWETHPERLVVNDMRRDNSNLWQGDNIAFLFDTFYDRRNGVEFGVAPNGGRYEGQVTNERQYNGDWNPVWDVAVGRFDNGWTVEIAIPFKSLRYRPGAAQVWGFQARRINASKNELSFITALPRFLGMGGGIFAASLAPTVVGIEAPPPSKNLEVKSYALGSATAGIGAEDALGRNAGVDVKYGLTPNLTADFTYRTDFAQVEADEQQVNLTRFSLFFPEKREFFLENQGLFAFGGASVTAGGDVPVLFYSRRIGLNGTRAAPIHAGGRLTGRLGRFSVGALTIQSAGDERIGEPGANFAVVRVKRDLFRRSSVGAIVTRRTVDQRGSGHSDTYGIDGAFSFFTNLTFNTYWARTPDRLNGNESSYRAQLDYAGDRYGLQLERLAVGDNFRPDAGYVRRDDIVRHYAFARFSPRPRASKVVRKLWLTGAVSQIENGSRRLESRLVDGTFAVDFQSGDRLVLTHNRTYEFLPQPFRIAPGVMLPVGGYHFANARAAYSVAPQRPLSGYAWVEHGTFYDGRRTTVGLSGGRAKLAGQLFFEPGVSINAVRLVEGVFTATLVTSRLTYTVTPLVFASALVQYTTSANTLSANARLRWEYQPGSELFVVYNEERDTATLAPQGLRNRSFVIKVNRLFRF
ncbi:MAG TPA: DUF5916 domain-containing protein [Vicinamibacterales bacterium]|nr:DUF5916 domain-containing protein [Vicinamibacterales bacterium]